MNQIIEQYFKYWVAPVLFCSTYAIYALVRLNDTPFLISIGIALFALILMLLCAEGIQKARVVWKPNVSDWKLDGSFFLVIQGVDHLMTSLGAVLLLYLVGSDGLAIFYDFWPHHLSVPVQCVLMVLVGSLGQYVQHRLFHEVPWLWRFHATHHSAMKMNLLMSFRIHPVDLASEFLFEILPLFLLGINPELIALYIILHATTAFILHSNIETRLGWMRYVFCENKAHRFHHSNVIKESNSNYGTVLVIWDLLLGSFYVPRTKDVTTLGLKYKEYPSQFLGMLMAPFQGKYYQKENKQKDFARG